MSARALVLSLLGGALVSAPVAAQTPGLPVVNNGVATGLQLAADIGFSNADAGKATTIGGTASLGLGFVGVSGTIARYNPKVGDAFWAPGVSASLRLLGGPLIPLRVVALAGISRWTYGNEFTHVPVSLGISATIPSPGFAIKPWVAPRVDFLREVATGGDDITDGTSSRFGISGGIELGLLNGMSIRAAYDRVSVKGGSPSILSFGIGFQP